MPDDKQFRAFVLDQLSGLREFETKPMFGGTALLVDGRAFAKVKHGALWLKVDDTTRSDFLERDMPQYTYGKDNTRRLNFFQTPPDVLEDANSLVAWVNRSLDVVLRSQT